MFKVKELKNMRDIFENHGKEVLRILDAAVDTGAPIDIADLFFRFLLFIQVRVYTMDILTDCSYQLYT